LWSKLIGPLGEARLDLSGFLEPNMASLKKCPRALNAASCDRLRSNCRSGERKIPNRPEPNPQSSTLKDKSVLPTNQKTIIGSGVAQRFSSPEFQPMFMSY
jgi:hypothetical protein